MTVSVNDAYTSFTTNGSTSTFNYDFPCDDADELLVYLDDELQETGYSVDLVTKTVTFSSAPATGKAGVIARDTPAEQLVDYSVWANSLNLAALGAQLDNIVYKIQELDRDLGRALKASYGVSPSLLPAPSSNKYLGWNDAATALVNKTAADLGAVEISNDPLMASTGEYVVSRVSAAKAYIDAMKASVSTREFVVTDPTYGADPNAADTRNAINAAISAAASAGGGVVRLPPGTYTVVRGGDSAVGIILRDNVYLRGAGPNLTTIKCANGTSVMHLVGNLSANGVLRNSGLFDLTIDGNGHNFSGTGGAGSHGIRLAGFDGFFLQNVAIKNTDHHGLATLTVGASTGIENKNLFIDNVYLENIGTGGWQGGDGLRVFYGMQNCVINNVIGRGIEYHGIHIAYGACVLNNVTLYNVGNAALSPQSDGCMVNNLHIEWEDGYVVNDLFANRPAAGVPGRFFRASDTGTVYRDNGVAWKEAAANFTGVWAITRGGFPTGGKSSYSNVKIVFRVTENVAWSPAYGDGFRLDVPHAMANNIQVYGKFRFGIFTTEGNNTIENSVVDGVREDGYRIVGNDNTIDKWKVVTANLSGGANYAVRLTGQRSKVLHGRNLDGTNIVTDIAETGTADANIIAGNHLAGSGDRMLMIGANSKHYGNIGLSYDYADISDTVAPADTNLNVLKSRTLRTSELPLGKEFEVFVSGTMSGSAATRTLKMYFGGQEFNISVQAAGEAQDWAGWMRIRRLTSTTGYWIQTSGQEENGNNTPAGGRYGITSNSAVGVKAQKGDAADTITCTALVIRALP